MRFLNWISTFAFAALAVGYLGWLHPAADTIAVLRPYLAGAVAAIGVLHLLTRRRFWGVVFLAFAFSALLPIYRWQEVQANATAHELRLYQKNMRFRVADPARIGKDIFNHAPDFVALQEVSGVNMAVFDPLEGKYLARQFCPFATVGGVAVASRWPQVPGSGFCAEADGLAAMQVETPVGKVWVVSIHLHWPWPYSQPDHLARLVPKLQSLEGGVVIGADLNAVPWSNTVATIAQASDTSLLGPPHVTLAKANGWFRTPVDHVLVSGGQGQVTRLDRLGSDHFGLLARFQLPVRAVAAQ